MDEREAILQQAHEAYQQRNYPLAYDLYEALLQMFPGDPQVRLAYGKAVYLEYEDLEKALRLFEKVTELDSTTVEALLWQADIASLGYGPSYQGAVSLYRQAIHLDPNCVDAYIGLGLQYQAPSVTLSLEQAIDAFGTAIFVARSHDHGPAVPTQRNGAAELVAGIRVRGFDVRLLGPGGAGASEIINRA